VGEVCMKVAAVKRNRDLSQSLEVKTLGLSKNPRVYKVRLWEMCDLAAC
jgi:hypothetical protein